MTPEAPRLVGFAICPFVQRVVIAFRERSVDYRTVYIEPDERPAWFTAMSPLGKVPVLQVGDVVLFESSAILEFVNDVYGSLHPEDPLRRAHNRAWIEFASQLTFEQYRFAIADRPSVLDEKRRSLTELIDRLEREYRGPAFFNGSRFSLVDVAFAPVFLRFHVLEAWRSHGLLAGRPGLTAWGDRLLNRRSVRGSVEPDFTDRLYRHLRDRRSVYIGTDAIVQ